MEKKSKNYVPPQVETLECEESFVICESGSLDDYTVVDPW